VAIPQGAAHPPRRRRTARQLRRARPQSSRGTCPRAPVRARAGRQAAGGGPRRGTAAGRARCFEASRARCRRPRAWRQERGASARLWALGGPRGRRSWPVEAARRAVGGRRGPPRSRAPLASWRLQADARQERRAEAGRAPRRTAWRGRAERPCLTTGGKPKRWRASLVASGAVSGSPWSQRAVASRGVVVLPPWSPCAGGGTAPGSMTPSGPVLATTTRASTERGTSGGHAAGGVEQTRADDVVRGGEMRRGRRGK
jgi:hypothetical protein